MKTLLFVAAALLVNTAAYAQPARPATPPDISGEWRLENDEEAGALGALGQPPLGDYLGIPFNDAGRMRADTSAESIWGTPEYQCRPHSAPHQWRGLGGARILKEEDPLTRDVSVYHIQFMLELRRTRAEMRAEGLIHGESRFPVSLTLIVAVVLLALAILTIASMQLHTGPFA